MRKTLLGAIVLLVVFAMPALAQDSGGGGIGGRPAYPREDNSRSESIFIHTLDAGQSQDDGIKIINNTDEPRTIQVYATDSIVSSGGAFACKQLAEEQTDVGSWITLERAEVTLDGAGSEIVDFNILVPLGTDVGEHDGCIVVQEKKPLSDNEQGIGLSFRTALRVALLVPGDITKNLEIVDFQSTLNHDEVVLTPQIENTGNVSVDTEISTTLSHFFGREISEAGGQFPVLRGQIGEWNFQHDRPFWGGIYKAEVSAIYDSDTDNFIGSESGESKELSFASHWLFIVPHPIAFAVELIILVATVYGLYRLRKRLTLGKRVKNDWHTHTVRSDEDIKSLAKATSISWKKLAKANKLKAPYTLKSGEKVRVPKKLSTGSKKPQKIDVIK